MIKLVQSLLPSGRTIRGFTVVEMLVVALIMAALMAIAIPQFLSAMNDSKRKECRLNMRAIANAERQYMLKDAGQGHAPAFAGDMTTLKTKVPINVICPSTDTPYGIAIIGNPGDANYNFTVSCNIGAHNAGVGSEPAGYTPGSNTQ